MCLPQSVHLPKPQIALVNSDEKSKQPLFHLDDWIPGRCRGGAFPESHRSTRTLYFELPGVWVHSTAPQCWIEAQCRALCKCNPFLRKGSSAKSWYIYIYIFIYYIYYIISYIYIYNYIYYIVYILYIMYICIYDKYMYDIYIYICVIYII